MDERMFSARFFVALGVVAGLLLVGCGHLPFGRAPSKTALEQNSPGEARPGEVAEEVSLKADRGQFAELRKQIPEETRRENDELAFVLELMARGDEEPGRIRDRFNKALRDRRSKHDKDLRKQREEFTKQERKSRDSFLKAQAKERESFLRSTRGQKHSDELADERQEFFKTQDEKRREYFANERDARKEFESRLTEARRAFEDYAREKTNHFNQEYRAYASHYYERKKALDLQKRTEEKARTQERHDASSAVLRDWERIPEGPATPLGSSDE